MQSYKNFSLDTADTLLFGVSPFSSYYTVEKLFFLLNELKSKKKIFFYFFPILYILLILYKEEIQPKKPNKL